MIPPKYKFYISKNGSNKVEVTPHYKELNKKYAKESSQEFFRISLDGKINLFGSDYEIVSQSNIEDKLVFIIDKYNNTSKKWVEYYRGEFSKTDCKFDHDKKKCELKTTTIDRYTEVMNKYENTYDLIKLAPEISKINLHKRSLMQIYVSGSNSITNFFGGTYWESDVNTIIDSYDDLVEKYHFSYIKAGNEFEVKGAGIAEVNGVYAGTNGCWNQWRGYTAYAKIDTANFNYSVFIKRNYDSVDLYKSESKYSFNDANNIFIAHRITFVNIINPNDKFTIDKVFVYHIYRRLLCDVDTITDSEGTKNTYALPSDDFVTDNRNYKKCIGLTGGLFFCTSKTVIEPTMYGVNDYGQYFTNEFISVIGSINRPVPISKSSWANASLWYVYDSSYEYLEKMLRKQYTLKDSYSIGAAIKAILKKIGPNITHEPTSEYSQFLYGSPNPLGIERFYVYITQKTNILKGDYDKPAQKAETSLEELMKMLRDCFRCYWYIEDNKFKIEHIYFFMNGGSYSGKSNYQLDFTKLTDRFNKKLSSYFQSEIEYDKSELSQRYEFAWMDDVTDLFGGVTIDVKSNYIQKDKTEEINIGQFSSDIDYMLFNPSNFSEDGFALLCAIEKNMAKSSQVSKNLGINNVGVIISIGWSMLSINVKPGSTVKIKNTMYSAGQVGALGYSSELVTSGQVSYVNMDNLESDTLGYKIFNVPSGINYIYINLKPLSYDFTSIYEIYTGEYELPIIKAKLIDENGDSYNAIAQNWYASWIYLQTFYMWDMPARNIESNVLNGLYTRDIKKCMKHTIEFPIEEDLDELELIKTSFGNGKIDEYSVNMNTRMAKVNLLYRPQ